jgi:hypothetical protein
LYNIVQTDKKENKIFLIYKEIHMGSVAKSYMRQGFLIHEEMRKYLVIYIRRSLVIYDFATDPVWISLYKRKILFSFLSVHGGADTVCGGETLEHSVRPHNDSSSSTLENNYNLTQS